MATDTVAAPRGVVADARLTWGRMLVLSASILAVLHVLVAALMTDVDAAVLAVLLVTSLAAHRRWPRTLTPVLGFLLFDVAFFTVSATIVNLTTGVVMGDVLLGGVMAATSLVGLVAAFGAWRSPRGSQGTVPVAVGGAVLLSVVLLGAAMGGTPAEAGAGDIAVTGVNARFAPDTLEASPGTVAVHFTNDDYFWHTFSIPELGVRLAVPVGGQGRVTFDAPPGTYEFLCEIPGHERAMRGTLVAR